MVEVSGDEEGKEKKPKLRTLTGYLEENPGALLVYEGGPDPEGKIKYSEIKSITIKPAGTFYDGEVTFKVKGGIELKFKVKQYQQEDFEELKRKLGK